MNSVTDVPPDQVGAVVQTFVNTGSTTVIVEQDGNGNYTVSGSPAASDASDQNNQ